MAALLGKLFGFGKQDSPELPTLLTDPDLDPMALARKQEEMLTRRKKKGYVPPAAVGPFAGQTAAKAGRASTLLTGPSGIKPRSTLLGGGD